MIKLIVIFDYVWNIYNVKVSRQILHVCHVGCSFATDILSQYYYFKQLGYKNNKRNLRLQDSCNKLIVLCVYTNLPLAASSQSSYSITWMRYSGDNIGWEEGKRKGGRERQEKSEKVEEEWWKTEGEGWERDEKERDEKSNGQFMFKRPIACDVTFWTCHFLDHGL